MVTSSINVRPSLQVKVGVKATGKDDKSVLVGTTAVRDGVESTVLFAPQEDKRSHKQTQMDTGISFLHFPVSI
jgi:hypothetical protein